MARGFGLAAALLVVVASAAAVVVHAAAPPTPGSWKELVTLDCNGGIHWGNSQPLWRSGLDASLLKQLWDFAVARIQSRVKCHCPSLTDLQVQTHFNGSFAAVLQWFGALKTNPSTGLPNCQSSPITAFTTDVSAQGDSFSVNLPSTCSYESWAAGEPCLVQMPMPGLSGTTFQMAFDHCPLPNGGESNVPYVSVTCQGAACDDFMVPCNNNNDCSNNQQCSPLFGTQDTSSVLNWLRTNLPKANLWITGLFPGPGNDDVPQQPDSCTASTGDSINDQSYAQWVLNKLIGLVTPYTKMGSASLPITNLQFCGAGTWHTNSFINVLGQGCTKTYNYASDLTTYDCQLQSWDGSLSGGGNALDALRKTGAAFVPFAQPGSTGLRTTSPNVDDGEPVNLFTFPCGDGSDAPNDQLGVLLNSPGVAIKAALPVVHALQSAVVQVAATMADCRNGGVPLAPDQLDIRFNPGWATVLNAAVDHAPAHPFVPPESALADPYTAAYQALDPFTPYQSWPNPIVHLPDTCTLNSWLASGSCGFQYTGLQSLLNRDVTIRFGAYACPATPFTFGAHAECVGNGCRDVVQPYMTSYCRQDSDCADGRLCQQFPKLGRANYISDTFWNVFGDGSVTYISLQPPQSNFNYFSAMTPAQQAATITQLYADMINATNLYGAAAWGSYWQTVDLSSVDTLNSYNYWGTYPSITMYVKPQANTVNTFASAVQGSTQFLPSMPVGQYVSYVYPQWYSFPQYVQCPSNGAWVLDPTQCTPPDTCDTEPALEADLLNFILQATGQPAPNPPIDPTAPFHGYCATVFNNVTSASARAWARTQWGYDTTRANPKVIVLPAVTSWTPPVPPAPEPPTPGGGGLSDSTKAGVVTASVLGGALAIGAVFYCCIRKKPAAGAGIESANQPLAAAADRAV